MDKNVKLNLGDQAVKGGVLGLVGMLGNKLGFSPEEIAAAMPVILAVMAWLSTKIGDKSTTAIFSAKKTDAK